MKNFKHIILEEMDDLDWIRDIEPTIPFEDLVPNTKYIVEPTNVLLKAAKSCGNRRLKRYFYRIHFTSFIRRAEMEYRDAFCGHERDDVVAVYEMLFYDINHDILATFWVTEDMIKSIQNI